MLQSYDNYKYEPFANETFRHMPSADGVSSMVASNYLLGDVSGKIEWTQQPDKARDTFIHLSAYKHFIDEKQLILLGRTGSGKSAIIYGLKDDIQNGIIDNYSDVIQIDEKDFCEKLAEMCYGIDINRFDATNKVTSAVTMAIYTRVIRKVLVLLDSFDEYKVNDKAFVIAVKSLILACFRVFCDSSQNHIFLKWH